MTYRSETPFGSTNYDNFAFKKSELLEILQAIDSSFSFNVASSYKDTFFKHDAFDGFEVACLISGYDPNKLTIDLTRSTIWRKENPKFVEALNLVMSVDIEKSRFWQKCDANFYECEYVIKNKDLKTYLASKNIFIEDFNNISTTKPIAEQQPLDKNIIQQKNENLSNHPKSQYDYKFYLLKKPLLTFHEAACIMTGYDPQYVNQCENDTNFKQNFSDYLGAYEYLDACIDAKLLPYDSYNNKLEAISFKQFLANEQTFIDGFNDNLSVHEPIGIGQPSMQQTEPNIENLNAEITQLRKLVAEKDVEIEQLKTKQSIEQLGNQLPDELTGLSRRNQLAQDRQGMARIIALNLWKSDETILIGDMANKVYAVMVDYCREELPDTSDTIKNWIRPVATPQAQLRGRKPKNQ
ncbi:hypothetical protein [Acinetobacter ursingii]|uniref:hypothetical protein n=1 Tax=Acinetobacter ursingii TaxID=108980 RepID=UPI0021CDCC43|nr:hypothetical protein [Acinetobacter ursingii]